METAVERGRRRATSLGRGQRREKRRAARVAASTALTVAVGLVPTVGFVGGPAQSATVDQGFDLNPSDLKFILKQIKIAERHARTATSTNPCGTLVGPNADQIPQGPQAQELPFGLRTVDGTCNNLMPGQSRFGAADQRFPRMLEPVFRDGEVGDPDGPHGPEVSQATSYKQKTGTVIDSRPRVISNLVVDQTTGNPAAVSAAGPGATPDDSGNLYIPNVAPDAGLSAPYNSLFTLFGQFFDHGLDLTNKGGGLVYMPLKDDDPLIVGPDGRPGTADDPANPPPPGMRFMVLTRATNQPGPDGQMGTADDVQNASNQTTPFVDQNQTYTSHPSHQVFLRDYVANTAGQTVSSGRLLNAPGGGMATWADVKAQARTLLGIRLRDTDVLDVPLLATDQYGRFARGPNGHPQLVLPNGTLREGDPAAPVTTGNVLRTGHAFLADIAHHAVPVGDLDRDPSTPPTPLTPDSSAGTSDDRDPSTYDDEMLNAHFMAGDGRVNENIGLISVHHIFHAEHNRLTGHVKDVLQNDDPASLSQWRLADGSWNGERLFQAARFVTEMEYQHLAFEEFARRVQPQVNVFTGYDTSINPAIKAEFAHTVYRFGHSMLTETVDRTNADGTDRDIALLEAFLNPPEFTQGGALTPDQATGSIMRGMSQQVGSEMDEFVTESLRNKLLGLPLDLASINIARGRDTGIPPLNEARRQFFAATNNNSALEPYESWFDFGLALRHPESLVNFVAAYGTHPTITGTLRQRRTAAARLVANDPTDLATPADSQAFMNSTGAWRVAPTGLEDVDLWVGGLAERQAPFGGLLGPTFNYVFETQMEDLQDGDRFYYLSRTAGLNLLAQLEGNSFAELIMRNSDAEGLPADVFARPDYVFDLAEVGRTGPILDDAATDYDERELLIRMPDGTVRYSGEAHVVFNGTGLDDRVRSSEGDDTVRGGDADDRLEGGAGNDGVIGGAGDDIVTDSFGDDDVKGGPGNDAINSGAGFDLIQGGRGSDYTVGGADPTETLAGPGHDLVIGGDSEDFVFGGDGDDWLEGGAQADELTGDSGALFQDDLNTPGHDVLDGGGGSDHYDAEGGDDIMVSGPGVERNEGMRGYDWVTHKNDPQPADSDMEFTGLLPPSLDAFRDRFDLVEGLSGWKFDDVLRGDDGIPDALAGRERPQDHSLDAAGIARVDGLAALLPAGTTSFGNHNVLLGGAGNDIMEGRGGDDVVDGDAWLDVRLRAPDPATTAPNDTQLVDSMNQLRADVFAGRINPGQVFVLRTVETAAPGTSGNDTAVFSDRRANYDCVVGSGPLGPCPTTSTGVRTTVVHAAGTLSDGTDTLTNVENLVFSDTVPPGTPTITAVTAGNTSATVTWAPPRVGAVEGYRVKVVDTADPERVHALVPAGPKASSAVVTGLTNGRVYRFRVQAWNFAQPSGDGDFSALSDRVTPAPQRPAAPNLGTVVAGNQRLAVNWTAGDDNGADISAYTVRVTNPRGRQVARLTTGPNATRAVVTGLVNGRTYWAQVWATNAVGAGARAGSTGVTPAAVPVRPAIGTAAPRNAAALVRWSAPTDDRGAAISAYRIRVVTAAGRQVGNLRRANAVAVRKLVGGLTNGRAYRFQVAAVNTMGTSRFSRLSNVVRPRPR